MSPEPFPEMLRLRSRPSKTRRYVGKATSIMWPPTLKTMIVLASVGREHAAAGTLLTVEAVRRTVAARVVPLLFFNPLRKTATPVV
jgi:glycine cleavage system aminomethyltransferase T